MNNYFSKFIFAIGIVFCFVCSWISTGQVVIGDKQIYGSSLFCCECCDNTAKYIKCGSLTGDLCTSIYSSCNIDMGGIGDCALGEGQSPHNCLTDSDCVQFKNDACMIDEED